MAEDEEFFHSHTYPALVDSIFTSLTSAKLL